METKINNMADKSQLVRKDLFGFVLKTDSSDKRKIKIGLAGGVNLKTLKTKVRK